MVIDVFMLSVIFDLATPIVLVLTPIWASVLPCQVMAVSSSPAKDHKVKRAHPQATLLLRVRGESMEDASIFDDDAVLGSQSQQSTLGSRSDGCGFSRLRICLQDPAAKGRAHEA